MGPFGGMPWHGAAIRAFRGMPWSSNRSIWGNTGPWGHTMGQERGHLGGHAMGQQWGHLGA